MMVRHLGCIQTTLINITTMETCSECGKTFGNSRSLIQHCSSLGHSMETCSVCGKTFSSRRSLDQHRSSLGHSTTCLVCSKEFFDIVNITGAVRLPQHIKKTGHHASSKATCPRCAKTFHLGGYHSAQFKLSMHMRTCR